MVQCCQHRSVAELLACPRDDHRLCSTCADLLYHHAGQRLRRHATRFASYTCAFGVCASTDAAPEASRAGLRFSVPATGVYSRDTLHLLLSHR